MVGVFAIKFRFEILKTVFFSVKLLVTRLQLLVFRCASVG